MNDLDLQEELKWLRSRVVRVDHKISTIEQNIDQLYDWCKNYTKEIAEHFDKTEQEKLL